MTPDVLLIRKMMSRQNLTRAESAELLETILRSDGEGWKILAYSVASQTKGETVEEILGMFDAMRRLTGDYDLDLAGRRPMDISSAGGSGVRKINVSTLTALIAGDPSRAGHQALVLEGDQHHRQRRRAGSGGHPSADRDPAADPEGGRAGGRRLLLAALRQRGAAATSSTSGGSWARSRWG